MSDDIFDRIEREYFNERYSADFLAEEERMSVDEDEDPDFSLEEDLRYRRLAEDSPLHSRMAFDKGDIISYGNSDCLVQSINKKNASYLLYDGEDHFWVKDRDLKYAGHHHHDHSYMSRQNLREMHDQIDMLMGRIDESSKLDDWVEDKISHAHAALTDVSRYLGYTDMDDNHHHGYEIEDDETRIRFAEDHFSEFYKTNRFHEGPKGRKEWLEWKKENPEDAEVFDANTEKYKDVIKEKHKSAFDHFSEEEERMAGGHKFTKKEWQAHLEKYPEMAYYEGAYNKGKLNPARLNENIKEYGLQDEMAKGRFVKKKARRL